MTNTYSNNLIGVKESETDEFLLLNPLQTPMLNLLGFGDPVTSVEHVWFEDEMFAQESTLTKELTVGAAFIDVEETDAFRPKQVIRVGEELILVVKVEGEKLTVVRGYAGTEAETHEAGSSIEVMFVEGHEGADARDARYKPRKRVSNITQIFDDSVELTGTAQAIAQYGINDAYEMEKQKKQLELALQLEKALVNGVRYERGNTRMMRGVRSFIQTNVIKGDGAAISDEHLVEAFRAIFEKSGSTASGNYKIIVGATQKIAISAFDNALIRLSREDNGRGNVVDHFVSDFGNAEIVLNNNLRSDEIFVIDANRLSIRPLQTREFSHTFLGKTGDYMRGMLVGEYTLEFLQEAAHAKIVGLAS
ncbi:SU10 major capsid protein [Bacillus mycoides]|uniref:SU10 major capsid protein n=1 Tax=Bacillus mycoides TaxID=1405 RepID=UPI003D64B488